ISTADVYKTPQNVDENTPIDENDLQTYGKNRYLLEKWVRENIENHLIVRLPGLFGKGIKKNFLFDMLTVIPSMLTISKYDELCQKSDLVKTSYTQLNDKFYKLSLIDSEKLQTLKTFFANNDFNALSFTDSRAAYQFYNLADLWGDINTALDSGLHTVNLTSEPVLAREIYTYLNGGKFVNEITDTPVYYDIKSVNAACFGGKNGYIKSKDEILAEIKKGFPSKFENM
ncbi:MAG: sugar nucleotide-binding protein, partial [Oscillospiraceae bacterium]